MTAPRERPHVHANQDDPLYLIGGQVWLRVAYGYEHYMVQVAPVQQPVNPWGGLLGLLNSPTTPMASSSGTPAAQPPCPGCGVAWEDFHVPGCVDEACPACQYQRLSECVHGTTPGGSLVLGIERVVHE